MLDSIKHSVFADLCSLGLSNPESLRQFHQTVRDRDDVFVLKCERSGALLLSSCDQISTSYYQEKQGTNYWQTFDPRVAVLEGIEDLDRRAAQLHNLIPNKRWLDIGTGVGGILGRVGSLAAPSVPT